MAKDGYRLQVRLIDPQWRIWIGLAEPEGWIVRTACTSFQGSLQSAPACFSEDSLSERDEYTLRDCVATARDPGHTISRSHVLQSDAQVLRVGPERLDLDRRRMISMRELDRLECSNVYWRVE